MRTHLSKATMTLACEVDGLGFHGRGAFYNLSGLPTFISSYDFCYCGHAVFPTICISMKDGSRFFKHVQEFLCYFRVILWWIALGVASSIGLGGCFNQ